MKILLITPPFCQLNTPYPGTAFLKSWLIREGHQVIQSDTGLETYLRLFSRKGLEKYVFGLCDPSAFPPDDRIHRLWNLRQEYLETIDPVISYLQGKDSTLATLLCRPGFLPEGERFSGKQENESFGSLGISDRARLRASLYLEDLADFHRMTLDEDFGFSRYADRLAMSPPSFDGLYDKTRTATSAVSLLHREILKDLIEKIRPEIVGFSIPFPGNLTEALRGALTIRQEFPDIHITLGGGYINTELREMKDIRLGEYVHSVTLDDGEDALASLLCCLEKGDSSLLTRTWLFEEGRWVYSGDRGERLRHRDREAPDYSDLPLDRYLSLVDNENPMHRLWSEGPWIKMMLAHGCYWHRCAFCDTSLDYICRYDPAPASRLADQIEELISKTGKRSFHFVDEAAPPALLRELALELIRRKTAITWWTNIRFEKNFSPNLCRLLARSGCIAVSGGLEVASDRLLESMDKGVSVKQVAGVTAAFRRADIMVHAYLMYGFPGQSPKELIDSLEVVRQLFRHGLIQSAYWHHFALTAHSPVGLNPQDFGVTVTGPQPDSFTRNDLEFKQTSEDLNAYGEGLRTSLYNFMRGEGFQLPLKKWFPFKTPSTSVSHRLVQSLLEAPAELKLDDRTRLLWTGALPQSSAKGLIFRGTDFQEEVGFPPEEREFILKLLAGASPDQEPLTLAGFDVLAKESGLDPDVWLESQAFRELTEYGLLFI